MSSGYLAAFVAVAAVAVAGVDYVNQARRAGSAPGAFAAADYVASVQARLGMAREAAEAAQRRAELDRMAPRDLLPGPPEGWTRRDLTEADIARLERRYRMAEDDFLPPEMKDDPTLKLLAGAGEAARDRADAREVHVYESEGQIIALRLRRLDPTPPGGIGGLGMQIVAGNLRAMSASEGYAMVGGVAYRLEQGLFGGLADEGEKPDYRIISGRLGEELEITARAVAPDEAVMTLLSAIDYDRLNAALEAPLAGVGNDAPVLDPAASRAAAEAQVRRQDAEAIRKGREAEARLASLGGQIAATGADAGAVPGGLSEDGAPEAGAAEGQGGGIFAAMKARFLGAPKPAAAPAPAEAEKAEVRVHRGATQGNCQNGLGKRCSVGD